MSNTEVVNISDATNRSNSQYNSAFVLMQYFGYLGGTWIKAATSSGWTWSTTASQTTIAAWSVRSSPQPEYQMRFGSAVTHTNQDCGQ
jgi:hypothetical protein